MIPLNYFRTSAGYGLPVVVAATLAFSGSTTFAQKKEQKDGVTRPIKKAPGAMSYTVPSSHHSMEKIAFLGVVTRDLEPSLRQHLEIQEGFGLQVGQVAGGSPAAESGVKAHDILLKFDDQLLTTPQHLATLVKSREKGGKVVLTILRKGDEKTLDVTLAEHEVPRHPKITIHGFHPPAVAPGSGIPPAGGKPQEWQEAMKQYQDSIRKHHQPDLPDPAETAPKNALPRPEGARKPPAISVSPGYPIQVFGTKGVVKIDNGKGEVTIQEMDGKHTISIQDKDGKVVYDGDFNPDKGVDSLPEEAREQLKEMKLDNLNVLTPGGPLLQPKPEKVPAAKPEKISNPSIQNPPNLPEEL